MLPKVLAGAVGIVVGVLVAKNLLTTPVVAATGLNVPRPRTRTSSSSGGSSSGSSTTSNLGKMPVVQPTPVDTSKMPA